MHAREQRRQELLARARNGRELAAQHLFEARECEKEAANLVSTETKDNG